MLLPTDNITTASFKEPKANSLHLAIDRTPTAFWVISDADKPVALFLSGSYAGQGFYVTEGADWAGVAVNSVDVRIDPSSAHDGNGNTNWALRASGGTLQVPVAMKVRGFPETVWVPVKEISTIQNLTVYFARWSLGIEIDDKWVELVSASGGKLAGSLLPETE